MMLTFMITERNDGYFNDLTQDVIAGALMTNQVESIIYRRNLDFTPCAPAPESESKFAQLQRRRQTQHALLEQLQQHLRDISPYVMLVAGGITETHRLNHLLFFQDKTPGERMQLRRIGCDQRARYPHLINVRESWRRLKLLIESEGYLIGTTYRTNHFLSDSLVEILSAVINAAPAVPDESITEIFLLEWIDSTTINSHKYLTERVRILDPPTDYFQTPSVQFIFSGMLGFPVANLRMCLLLSGKIASAICNRFSAPRLALAIFSSRTVFFLVTTKRLVGSWVKP